MSSLVDLVEFIINNNSMELYTSTPGVIINYDSATRKATVKPLHKTVRYLPHNYDSTTIDSFKELIQDPTSEINAEEYPQIFNVPVHQLSSNGDKTRIHMPIKRGDIGMIMFTMRSIDNYLSGKGETYTVDEFRHHDINDAYFVPGILPFSAVKAVANPNNITIEHGSTAIELDENGKVKINNSTVDIVAALYSLVELLANSTVATLLGPQPLSTKANLEALKAQLNTIKF